MDDYSVTTGDNAGNRNRASKTLLTIVLIIIVAIASVGGGYYWRQHKINDLNNQISTLTSRISTLQKQSNASQKSVAPSQSNDSGSRYASQKGVQVIVYVPDKNAKLTSPVGVVGKVPGNWSFEASFPVQLKDASGKVVAQGTGQLLGDWMTDQLVPFSAKLTYSSVPTGSGTLVLQKDNPSGQVSNDDLVTIPVRL